MKFLRTLAALVVLAVASPAVAQWQVPNGAIPYGRGAGATGFGTVTNNGTGKLCLLNTVPPAFGACPNGNLVVGTTVVTGGSDGAPLYNNAGVLANGLVSSTWANFLQVGIGAVSRTAQSKLRESISVLDYGALCDGSHDDTAAFQAAINALASTNGQFGGTILIPWTGITYPLTGGGCIISSSLNLNAKVAITIGGVAGFTAGAATPSIIYFTGSGARFIDARDSTGVTLKNLYIAYTNPSFTGILVDAGGNTPATPSPTPSFGSSSSKFTLKNAVLAPAGVTSPAATLLNLDQSIEADISGVNFSRGAPAIRGAQVYPGTTTGANIHDGQFVGHVGAAIKGCGEAWSIHHIAFEADSLGRANAFENTTGGNILCKTVSFENNWFGDVTLNGGTWITFHGSGFTFSKNTISGNDAVNNIGITFQGVTSGVEITGNTFQWLSGAVGFNSLTTGVKFSGNDWSLNVSNVFLNSANVAGINSDNNNPPASQQATGQISIGQFGADPFPKTVSGDATLSAAGALTVTKTNGSSFGPLATATPGTGVTTFLTTPSSANLAAAVTDETGTGALVFGTSPNITTPTGIVKGDVGLGNVDNTSDANKPVSTAQATAIALKANAASPAFTGSNTTTNNQNNPSTVFISNNDPGAAAQATMKASNGTNAFEFGMRGTGQVTYGALTAGRAFMYGAVDFVVMSDGGNLIFASGSNSEKARLTTTGGLAVGTATDPGVGAITANTTVKATTGYILTNLLASSTAPVATSFCTSPSIPANNGTAAFTINVGVGCASSTGTVAMPAATTGWVCDFHNVTTPASNVVEQTGGTTTTVTLTNYARTTGTVSNWTDSHVIRAKCAAY